MRQWAWAMREDLGLLLLLLLGALLLQLVAGASVKSVTLPISFVRPTADSRASNGDADRPVAFVSLGILPAAHSSSTSHLRATVVPASADHNDTAVEQTLCMKRVSAEALRNTVGGSAAHVLRTALDFGSRQPAHDTTALWLSDASRLAAELRTAVTRGSWIVQRGGTGSSSSSNNASAVDDTHYTSTVNFGRGVTLRISVAIVPAARVTLLAGDGSGADAVLNVGPWSELWFFWPHGLLLPSRRNALVLCASAADCSEERLAAAPGRLQFDHCGTDCSGEAALWPLVETVARRLNTDAARPWNTEVALDTRLGRGSLGFLPFVASGASGDPFAGTAAAKRCRVVNGRDECTVPRLALFQGNSNSSSSSRAIVMTTAQLEAYFRPLAEHEPLGALAASSAAMPVSSNTTERLVLGALALWELCREASYNALLDRWTCRGAIAGETYDAALGATSLALLPSTTVAHVTLAAFDRGMATPLLAFLALLGLAWLTGGRHAVAVAFATHERRPPRSRLHIIFDAGLVVFSLTAALIAAVRSNCCYGIRTGLFEGTDAGTIGIGALVAVVLGTLLAGGALIAANRTLDYGPLWPWQRVYAQGMVVCLCGGLLGAMLPAAAHVPLVHALLSIGLGIMTMVLPLAYATWGIGAAVLEAVVPAPAVDATTPNKRDSDTLSPPLGASVASSRRGHVARRHEEEEDDDAAELETFHDAEEMRPLAYVGHGDDDDDNDDNRAETEEERRHGILVALALPLFVAAAAIVFVQIVLFVPVANEFVDALLLSSTLAPIVALLITGVLVFAVLASVLLELLVMMRARLLPIDHAAAASPSA